ncbi:MAG: D-alanyl-D-alanine carboxypeptidase, partial [Chitinophagaceae bacterium]
HTGVAIYDADQSKYLYQFNSNKYFVPASNTKIPTLYAGMKWLGDRLPALRVAKRNDTVFISPTGDPTFLHSDFAMQPAADFLRKYDTVAFIANNWQTEALGYGWAWDDYQSAYMAERSPLPVFGNTVKWKQQTKREAGNATELEVAAIPAATWNVQIDTAPSSMLKVSRPRTENVYTIRKGKENLGLVEMPFVTNGANTAAHILQSTLGVTLIPYNGKLPDGDSIIYSQSADSMYRLLMHRSDNFFAEQTLLMTSERMLGVMDEQKLIDTLLKSELKDFPQKPRWVDGSGLSRYNLFTPEDFVWILGKMKDDFGMERLSNIFPTGNTGTLRNFYKEDAGYIFAKTGTLSGHVALSGFLVTNKKRMLIFSVLVNNHQSSSVAVRRAVEKYLQQLRKAL